MLYAALACGVFDIGVIYGAGSGSRQISAVQDGAVVGTGICKLGARKGVEILLQAFKSNTTDPASVNAAVEKWEN